MVVKVMRWRPWPPGASRKYEVRLVVRRLEGSDLLRGGPTEEEVDVHAPGLAVEVRWKGQKLGLGSFKRTVKRNFTKEVGPTADGGTAVVEWDEEFQSVCALSGYKDNAFHPWEIAFALFNGMNSRGKNKVPVVGTASLNLAEFASQAEQKEFDLSLPLAFPSTSSESLPMLCISLSLLEIRTVPEQSESVQRAVVPISSPSPPAEADIAGKEDVSAIKAGLRKVKIFTDYVSSRRAKKACREEEGSEGRCSSRSEYGEYNYPFDSDSLDEFEEGESDEVKADPSIRKSFSYGTLAYANCAGGSFYSNSTSYGADEDLVYYSNRKSDVGSSNADVIVVPTSEQSLSQSSKRGLLSWRKRKLSFRSPKPKGEPLLKKDYGEEGGDDIDFDRRQLSSDESLALGWHKTEEDMSANRSSVSEFGDDNFAVGSWEHKEVISRDGQMKLQTQVFLASIDQRSEKAAGESACTALVAVIADWFQNNPDLMPIKSQFDSLIREGSMEWRSLCENETYRERFPDKHFDLETVLQAKIRPLTAVSAKSFIGFFHPEGMDEGRFDFLHGAMSFDNIWDEISGSEPEHPMSNEPQVYIVSWNDHFFILKVEPEAYYIIDTLGERLYEGCNQAYILKFDRNTTILKLPNAAPSSDENTTSEQQVVQSPSDPTNQQVKEDLSLLGPTETNTEEPTSSKEEEEVVCQGKESCKEYMKSFLAAIPIRELQADIRKGLMASTPLHHRLQIEFHYTQHSQPMQETDAECMAALPPSADPALTKLSPSLT